jgi:alpha-N-acetylglucosamine transferase
MRKARYIRNHIEIILITAGLVFVIASIIVSLKTSENLKAYNKYMCATYGYYPDCKTKLPVELRLQ